MHSYEDRIRAVELYYLYGRKSPLLSIILRMVDVLLSLAAPSDIPAAKCLNAGS